MADRLNLEKFVVKDREPKMIDVRAATDIQILIDSSDPTNVKVWVNDGDRCLLRAYDVKNLQLSINGVDRRVMPGHVSPNVKKAQEQAKTTLIRFNKNERARLRGDQ